MLARPTLSEPRRPTAEAGAEPKPTADVRSGQAKPADERFLLRVDGQAKYSFAEKAAAIRRGQEIKKSFPVVVVTVDDRRESVSELVDF